MGNLTHVSEHLPTSPESEGKERDPAWNLPASLATKSAVGMALESHIPAPDVGLRLKPKTDLALEGPSRYIRQDTGRSGDVLFQSDPRGIKKVVFGSDSYMVDEHRLPELVRSRTAYEYRPGDDPELLKTEWLGKAPEDDPRVVSEGEANWLLDRLATMHHLEQDAWTSEDDVYRSGGETPDSSEEP
jgi:hypothetical protein